MRFPSCTTPRAASTDFLPAVIVLVAFIGSACSPRESGRATANTNSYFEASDATFGVGLLVDDASAADEVGQVSPADLPDVTSGGDDAAGAASEPPVEAGPIVSPLDAGEACAPPIEPGDLVIDELMIESVAGAGDYGEWLEVRSTRDCALDLRGLRGEAPSGAKIRTFDIIDDTWLSPGDTFVVADSINPTLNHYLPGTVVAWGGRQGDVLRNKGGTVTLRVDTTIIDSLTFPAIVQTIAASISFPSDCAPSRRSDWTAWQFSTASWFPGYEGTPNAPNSDVLCP